ITALTSTAMTRSFNVTSNKVAFLIENIFTIAEDLSLNCTEITYILTTSISRISPIAIAIDKKYLI
ncbi:MAG: hypothetical protein AAFY21_12815, partial [Cyanobacteria bacterium J06641_2]